MQAFGGGPLHKAPPWHLGFVRGFRVHPLSRLDDVFVGPPKIIYYVESWCIRINYINLNYHSPAIVGVMLIKILV